MDIYSDKQGIIKEYLDALMAESQSSPFVTTEVQAQINLLMAWIALELNPILPPDITLKTDKEGSINFFYNETFWGGTSISFLYNKPSNFGYMAEKALSDIQDFIAEFTTNVWPISDTIEVRYLILPEGRYLNNTVYARFKLGDDLFFEMTPLNFSDPKSLNLDYNQDLVWKPPTI